MAMSVDDVQRAILAASAHVADDDDEQNEVSTSDAADLYTLNLSVWRDVFLHFRAQEEDPGVVCAAFESYERPNEGGVRKYVELSMMRFKVLMLNVDRLTKALAVVKEHEDDKEFKFKLNIHLGE